MRYQLLSGITLAACLLTGTSIAQHASKKPQSGPTITKEETIVLKNGHPGKTVIEVKDGRIFVNGDDIASVADAASGKVHKKIIIDNGREDGFLPPGDFPEYGENNTGRKAMLGVLTDPDDPGRGAAIREVTPNSAAAKAGLRPGDRITRVDQENISNAKDLVAAIGRHDIGDQVTITYERNRKENSLQATLTPAQGNARARVYRFGPDGNTSDFPEMPHTMQRHFPFSDNDEPMATRPRLGIRAEDRADGSGVLILDVRPESPAAAAGLKEGDVIRKVNGDPVGSVEELQQSLRDLKPADPVKLEYLRDGKTAVTRFELPRPIRQEDF